MNKPQTIDSNGPLARDGIGDIAPYVPGRTKADPGVKVIKLSSNEAALGPSPRAVEAFHTVSGNLHRYPDGDAYGLRQAIGAHFGLNPDRVICGAGSDELLTLLAQCYLNPGDEAVMSRHGFLLYEIATKAAGGVIIKVPETDLRGDVDAILGHISARTKIVFIANPNNPTGTYLTQAEMRRLQAGLPKHVLLVVDAAYAEFVRRNDYDAGIELVSGADNVVMTRTFSKVFGLAGLRIGWAFAPQKIIETLNRVRGPFNASIPAQAAAIAALEDRAFLETAITHNSQWLDWLSTEIKKLGLPIVPSVGNFLLVEFTPDKGLTASAVEAALAQQGILVRAVKAYGLENHLRISIGLEHENKAVIDALKSILGTDHG